MRRTAIAPLGGWVNNAAIVAKDSVHAPDPWTRVERLFRVNIVGHVLGLRRQPAGHVPRAALRRLDREHRLDPCPRAGFPNWAAYETSKAGIMGLTRNLAVEYGTRPASGPTPSIPG